MKRCAVRSLRSVGRTRTWRKLEQTTARSKKTRKNSSVRLRSSGKGAMAENKGKKRVGGSKPKEGRPEEDKRVRRDFKKQKKNATK